MTKQTLTKSNLPSLACRGRLGRVLLLLDRSWRLFFFVPVLVCSIAQMHRLQDQKWCLTGSCIHWFITGGDTMQLQPLHLLFTPAHQNCRPQLPAHGSSPLEHSPGGEAKQRVPPLVSCPADVMMTAQMRHLSSWRSPFKFECSTPVCHSVTARQQGVRVSRRTNLLDCGFSF